MTIRDKVLSKGFIYEYGDYELVVTDTQIINKIIDKNNNNTNSLLIRLNEYFKQGEIIVNSWIEYDITQNDITHILDILPTKDVLHSNNLFVRETQHDITNTLYISIFNGVDYFDIVDTSSDDITSVTLTYEELNTICKILKESGLNEIWR